MSYHVKRTNFMDMERTDSIGSSSLFLRQGQHIQITHLNQLPFQYHGVLGSGGSATVQEIEIQATGQRFAHKLLHRYPGKDLDKWNETVRNEINIMKRLKSHPHMVQLFGTYTCGREVGMLLLPVAEDGDLQAYLQGIQDAQLPATTIQRSVLYHAFGCLASGLNILIHNGRVIYTDFGISLDATDLDQTTTTGPPESFTRRYCAPEVANQDRRNRKSDVFSLACVFVEILAALEPDFDSIVSDGSPYWQLAENIREALNTFQTSNSRQAELLHTIRAMLEPTGENRIGADDLLHRVRTIQSLHSRSEYALFCYDCSLMEATENIMATIQEFDTVLEDTQTVSENEETDSQDTETASESEEENTDSQGAGSERYQNGGKRYMPHVKGSILSLPTEAALKKVLETPVRRDEQVARYMFIFHSLANFGMVKIGCTTDVPRRLKEWENLCKRPVEEYMLDTSGKRTPVKNARRVWSLVITELKDVRFREIKCEGCHLTHYEWFRTTPQHVAKVIKKFSSWMAKDPYHYDSSRDLWILDEEIGRQDMEMLCQPLAMEM
ncbi:kinase-like protein [Periconia macrospinosa]|uniref:Kinase-like protein n=1 Tax=Periconia macrospinosa TaxID=97972 RepID=A0A2V1DE81_9PLEO|nr:kinase-like protein [Periconia macrospinosa]